MKLSVTFMQNSEYKLEIKLHTCLISLYQKKKIDLKRVFCPTYDLS